MKIYKFEPTEWVLREQAHNILIGELLGRRYVFGVRDCDEYWVCSGISKNHKTDAITGISYQLRRVKYWFGFFRTEITIANVCFRSNDEIVLAEHILAWQKGEE